MTVKVRRVLFNNEHEDQKWYVIEGYLDGCPAVTKRDTISMAAIVSGDVVLADRVQKMKDDVAEYHANYLALQNLPEDL